MYENYFHISGRLLARNSNESKAVGKNEQTCRLKCSWSFDSHALRSGRTFGFFMPFLWQSLEIQFNEDINDSTGLCFHLSYSLLLSLSQLFPSALTKSGRTTRDWKNIVVLISLSVSVHFFFIYGITELLFHMWPILDVSKKQNY